MFTHRVVFLAAALGCLTAQAGWRSVMPIYGGPVNLMAVDGAGTVYAAANSGIFKSSDGGANWVSVTGDLPVVAVNAIATDPKTPGTLYAGTTQALYKSTDGGTHWTAWSVATGVSITEIAVAASDPKYVYASTWGSYVYYSSDAGATWKQSSAGLSDGWSGPAYTPLIAVDPGNPLRAYTATWRGGIFRSTNGGASWTRIAQGGVYWLFHLAVAPSSPNVLWAANDAMYTGFANIVKSTDYGDTWTGAGQPATSEDGSAVAVDPSNPNLPYVGTSAGLFKSAGGSSWTKIFAPSPGSPGVGSFVISPTNALQMYAGSPYSGIYLSKNGGQTWQPSNNGFAAASIANIDLSLAKPSTMYATADTVGVLKSTDTGSTWAPVGANAALQNLGLGGIAVSHTDPNTTVVSAGGNLKRSTDGGSSFSDVAAYSAWLQFSPLDSSKALASIADWQGGFLYSGNAGISWSVPQSIYIYPGTYAFHPSNPNIVMTFANEYTGAALNSLYIMWSNSAGNGGWQKSAKLGTGGLRSIALDQSDPTVLYLYGSIASENTQGIYKFTVNYSGNTVSGVTRVAGTFNNGLGTAVPKRLAYNSATKTLYLTTDHGVFRSTDRAATWSSMSAGLTYPVTEAIAITPDGAHVVVGTNGGIWEYDAGPAITCPPMPPGQVGVPYAPVTCAATGGTPPYTWSATGLPPGLTIGSSTGTISGTPTASGSFAVVVTATDASGAKGAANLAITIAPSSSGCGNVDVCLAVGNASGSGSVTVPIQITPTAAASTASCQLDLLTDPAKVTYTSAAAGGALIASGKSLACNPLTSGDVRCLAFGVNSTPIPAGGFASITYAVSSAFTSGTTAVTPTNCQCVSIQGTPLTTGCTAGSITPGCSCDVNGDGQTTVVDVQQMVNWVLTGAAATCHSGGWSVIDVQRIVNAVLGLGCH